MHWLRDQSTFDRLLFAVIDWNTDLEAAAGNTLYVLLADLDASFDGAPDLWDISFVLEIKFPVIAVDVVIDLRDGSVNITLDGGLRRRPALVTSWQDNLAMKIFAVARSCGGSAAIADAEWIGGCHNRLAVSDMLCHWWCVNRRRVYWLRLNRMGSDND